MWENKEKKIVLRRVLLCVTVNQKVLETRFGLLNVLKVFKQVRIIKI